MDRRCLEVLLLLLTGDSLRAPGLLQVLRIDIHAMLSERERTGSASSTSRPTSTDTYSAPFEGAFFTRRHLSHSYHTDPRYWEVVTGQLAVLSGTRLPGAWTVGVAGEISEIQQFRVFTGGFSDESEFTGAKQNQSEGKLGLGRAGERRNGGSFGGSRKLLFRG